MGDIPRPRRKRRLRYSILGIFVVAIAAYVFLGLSQLRCSCAVVDGTVLWPDTVKRGNMIVQVRGSGELIRDKKSSEATARVEVSELRAVEIVPGQTAEVDLHEPIGIVPGHVARIGPSGTDGMRDVYISFDQPVAASLSSGTKLDAMISTQTLYNVLYMGRPVHGEENSTVGLFKYSVDGNEGLRVLVKLGRSSKYKIQILDGLIEGDKVILSDMSNCDAVDRIRIK